MNTISLQERKTLLKLVHEANRNDKMCVILNEGFFRFFCGNQA
jgi:hypothetical protein